MEGLGIGRRPAIGGTVEKLPVDQSALLALLLNVLERRMEFIAGTFISELFAIVLVVQFKIQQEPSGVVLLDFRLD